MLGISCASPEVVPHYTLPSSTLKDGQPSLTEREYHYISSYLPKEPLYSEKESCFPVSFRSIFPTIAIEQRDGSQIFVLYSVLFVGIILLQGR